MRCYRCGCDNSETARICPGCGLSLRSATSAIAAAPPFSISPDQVISPVATVEQALGYATMGERFLAFVCDTSIEAVLVAAFLGYYAESSLDSDVLLGIAPLVIPWLYMTLSEVLFHRTIGKRLLRIQLRSDSLEQVYPSFFRILLRETLGKFVSGLILGIGFLAGGWQEKHKTWADRMANTVVVRTGIVSRRLKALLTVVLICANLGISYALTQASFRHKMSVVEQLDATERKGENLRLSILMLLYGARTDSPEEYQKTLAALPPMLNEYSRLVTEEQRLLMRLGKLATSKDVSLERLLYKVKKVKIDMRQEVVELVRKHVDLVMAFDPHRQTFRDLVKDRSRLLDEIRERSDRIKKLEAS